MKGMIYYLIFLAILAGCDYDNHDGRLAVYWMNPQMPIEETERLAKFDLVIADMDNMINNPESLRELKKRNPSLKLLAYSNPMELFQRNFLQNRPLQREVFNQLENKEFWWLRDTSGNKVTYWPRMNMLNLGASCPSVAGEKYLDYLARFLLQNVLSDKIWDGYFMDNSGATIAWVNPNIDADNDGAADISEQLDNNWATGIEDFLLKIRVVKGDKFLIIGNKGTLEFVGILDGKMFEKFPNDYLGDDKIDEGWHQSMENYFSAGHCSIINAEQQVGNQEHRLFVYASALLGDGYYAYGANISKWFPEYDIPLGRSLNIAACKGEYWEREYAKAIVRVWPASQKGEIIRR